MLGTKSARVCVQATEPQIHLIVITLSYKLKEKLTLIIGINLALTDSQSYVYCHFEGIFVAKILFFNLCN